MNLLFLIAKIAVVAFFLFMFFRSSKLVWGVGLLTVTSAILLDTFLGTFGQEEMLNQLGFFFYVIVGMLIGGAAFWFLGIMRIVSASLSNDEVSEENSAVNAQASSEEEMLPAEPAAAEPDKDPFGDLHTFISDSLSDDEVLDLAYDMGYTHRIHQAGVQTKDEHIRQILESAAEEDRISDLELAVERIKQPLPVDHLPRIEKIRSDSPPTILRQYMIATYTSEDLEQFSKEINLEWELISDGDLSAQVRVMLSTVDEDGRKEKLITLLQEHAQ
jgi:hypothetical protein